MRAETNNLIQIANKVYHNFKAPSLEWDWDNSESTINENGVEAYANGLLVVFDIDAYRSYNSTGATHECPAEHEVSYNSISIDNLELWDDEGNDIEATEKEIEFIIDEIKESIK